MLHFDGQDVMGEPWSDRRKRLDDLFTAGIGEPRVQLVPACDDARRLWATWVVEWGGEGIVLKHRRSVDRPGVRSRVWVEGEAPARAARRGAPVCARANRVGRLGRQP